MQNSIRGIWLKCKNEVKIHPVFNRFSSCIMKRNFQKEEKGGTWELLIYHINFNSPQNNNEPFVNT